PDSRPENFSRTIDILKAGFYHWCAVLPEIVIGIEFSDDFGNLVGTVEEQRNRRVLRGRFRVVEGLFCNCASGGGIDHFLDAAEALDALQKHQGGKRIVVVVGQWVVDGILVAVEGSQVEDVVQARRQRLQNVWMSNRAIDKGEARVFRNT